jgi:hypothetical protein
MTDRTPLATFRYVLTYMRIDDDHSIEMGHIDVLLDVTRVEL